MVGPGVSDTANANTPPPRRGAESVYAMGEPMAGVAVAPRSSATSSSNTTISTSSMHASVTESFGSSSVRNRIRVALE